MPRGQKSDNDNEKSTNAIESEFHFHLVFLLVYQGHNSLVFNIYVEIFFAKEVTQWERKEKIPFEFVILIEPPFFLECLRLSREIIVSERTL